MNLRCKTKNCFVLLENDRNVFVLREMSGLSACQGNDYDKLHFVADTKRTSNQTIIFVLIPKTKYSA